MKKAAVKLLHVLSRVPDRVWSRILEVVVLSLAGVATYVAFIIFEGIAK